MNWKAFWNNKVEGLQVGRVLKGQAMSDELMQRIASRIVIQLQLQPTDSLLDICCGNGHLSKLFLPHVKEIFGVDFSESLITSAQEIATENLHFVLGDATQFSLNQKFDKVLLYFSFQYFESYAIGKLVLQNLLKHAKPGAIILIGDVPNQDQFFTYYNGPRKWWQWLKQELKNSNDMGKFWSKQELLNLCNELGVKGEVVPQEPWQPYAHYRFDLLIYS
jgi:ubiquinone/menaquinone biosynthesis C-methylase UbiE